MPAQWLSRSNAVSSQVGDSLEKALRKLSQPRALRVLRLSLVALLALWLLSSVANLFWALYPSADAPALEGRVVNPVTAQPTGARTVEVDLEAMGNWHLFGEVSEEAPAPPAPAPADNASARDGIEEGARETRLQLRLRGVVASTVDGLGHAIIEHRNEQAVYAVEDRLPVQGEVTLAKVMQRQVVLDNGGTYELLTLFEESELDSQSPARAPAPAPAAAAREPAEIDKRSDDRATDLAQGYRDRLYQNPQSLAEVVSVSAVREDGQLQGYRIAPGRDSEEFAQLGFRNGDLVTSVNGIALNDPANTMRLYQTLRTATEAVFELDRGGQQVSVAVSLGAQENEPN